MGRSAKAISDSKTTSLLLVIKPGWPRLHYFCIKRKTRMLSNVWATLIFGLFWHFGSFWYFLLPTIRGFITADTYIRKTRAVSTYQQNFGEIIHFKCVNSLQSVPRFQKTDLGKENRHQNNRADRHWFWLSCQSEVKDFPWECSKNNLSAKFLVSVVLSPCLFYRWFYWHLKLLKTGIFLKSVA